MRFAFWLMIPGLLNMTACKNDPSPSQPPTELVADTTDVPGIPDPYYLKKYGGNIDGKNQIEMVLINWGDGYISGRYWYAGKNTPLELSGELNEDNSYVVYESIKGKETGFFSGILSDPAHLTGSWSNPSKTRNLSFEVYEMLPEDDETGWNGNWHLNAVWDSGKLMIGNVTRDSFDFAVSILRGTHTGTLEGRAALKEKQALYNQKVFEEEPCKLTFIHQGHLIQVEQASSNFACGFGARASAAGKYERRVRKEKATLLVGTGEGAVFPTQALHDDFKKMVSDKNYEIFAFNMQEVQQTKDPKTGRIIVTGFIPGLFGTNEAIIIFDQQGKMWAAAIDYEEISTETFVRYFTNDPAAVRQLPTGIEDWREGFRNLRVAFGNNEL